MASTLKHKAVNGVIWRIVEQGGKQIVQFGISVILARLIMPDQFGMVAMLTVFMSVAGCFISSGLGDALFRKNDRTQTDCSTVFWFSFAVSIVCYWILFFTAPLVSDFYEMPELTAILRVSAITIIIGTLSNIHRMFLSLELDFRTQAKFSIIGLIISGTVGVLLAYNGFQVWALVFQNIVAAIVPTVLIISKVKWRPSLVFSKQSFKEFFAFGSKLLGSSILDQIYSNLYSIVIGKMYRASDLAYYNRASNLAAISSSVPTGVLQSVTYPLLVQLQDNDESLKSAYRRIIRLCGFIIFPLCLGIGAVAHPLVNLLYTDVWAYTATLLSIIVFSLMWYPIHAVNLNYLIVKGRSDFFFKLEVIKKIQGTAILFITIPMGLEAMCYGSIVGSLLSLIWNTYYTGKYLKMSIIGQLNDLKLIIALSAVMYIAARCVANYMGNGIDSLICSVIIGAIIYIGGAFLFRFPEIKELRSLKK
jgi:O-antigen/teichoic acid export membrane protein